MGEFKDGNFKGTFAFLRDNKLVAHLACYTPTLYYSALTAIFPHHVSDSVSTIVLKEDWYKWTKFIIC